MKNYIYVGTSNSGKTTKLKEHCNDTIKKCSNESEILVFINNKSQSSNWEDVETSTFYKIIRNHVILFWPLIEEHIKSGVNNPKFLDMEISEYLLNKLVDKYRENGRFLDVTIPNSVLSSDILNNIAKLSLNCIEYDEIDKLLNNFIYSDDLLVKDNILCIKNIINVFTKKNIKEGVLNFSLACYLFYKYILNNKLYEEYLKQNIKYVIVDDLQEKSFLEIKLIEKLLEISQESYLSYNVDGPITRVLGADENSIKEIIFPKCNLIKLEERNMVNNDKIIIKHSTLRSEMILSIADKVENLVNEGYKESEIDIVGSFVDSIIEIRLKKELGKRNIKLKVMTRSGIILDNPYINSLITICLLVNTTWNILPNKDSIAKTLALILNIDMIRARYLTREITKEEPYELPNIDETIHEYIGIENIKKYERLRDWIYENRKEQLDVNLFFKKLFLDILLPLGVSKENLNACNYLINLAKEFLDYVNENEKLKLEKNKNFIDMVLKGIRVSNSYEEDDGNCVKLWTSYSYLLGSKTSKVQIWADSYSDVWHQIGMKTYYNPFIFLRENKNKLWDFNDENKYKVFQTFGIIKSLLRKTDNVYIYGSEYNSNGYEQKGDLLNYLNTILKGES